MSLLDLLRANLKVAEGLRLRPYTDTTGHLSIGYGRNLTAKGISLVEAEDLLDHDIAEAVGECRRFFPWVFDLSEARTAAVVELVFNLGARKLLKFPRTMNALREGRFADAAANLLRSHPWVDQVGPDRSGRIAKMIETGEA